MKTFCNCPFCSGEVLIKEVECKSCNTIIKGEFRQNRFSLFSNEQLYFIEIFLKNEGNIKLVEKDLGISYPTVKNKLQKIIEVLGYSAQITKEELKQKSSEKIKLLNELKNGKTNLEKTLKKLGELKWLSYKYYYLFWHFY